MHRADRRLRFATTRLATGLQVHYAEQGDPGGETILFLPAYADSWFSYSRVLPLLPARYHAYALDQRGHGDSERPACCYTVDDLAADTVAFLDAAGIERATLVGHSGSCFTARRAAVNHPDRVAGLVLIGALLSLAKPAVLAFQAAVHALEDPVPAQFAREFQAGAAHIPLPEGFLEGLVAESLKLPAHVWKAALDGLVAFDDAADLGRITASTLLIWGDHDAVVSLEDQQRLRDAVPDARLKVYPRRATARTGNAPSGSPPTLMPHATVSDRQIRSPVLYVGLVFSRRIWPAHVGCPVDPVGSRRVPSDRLDDQTDDQARQANLDQPKSSGTSDPDSGALPRTAVGAIVAAPVGGQSSGMRFGNVEVRPLGGGLGCLFMVLLSVAASVVLTMLVNLLLR